MIIEAEKIGVNLVVQIDGELDLQTSPEFRVVVDGMLNQHDYINHLILDLKKVSFVDSSGLGVILGRFKRLSAQGGKMSAINVSDSLKRLFELSGLLRIMTIYDDLAQAM